MKTQKSSCKKASFVIILLILLLTTSIVAFSGIGSFERIFGTADALNSADITSNATLIAGGADLWNSSTSSINPTVVNGIYNDLFGSTDVIDYIMNNANPDELSGTYNTVTYADYTDADGNTKNAGDYASGNYIVDAPTINSTISDPAKRDYGYVLKINGQDWMVSSMTIDLNGNPILTLYYAKGTTQSTTLTGSNDGAKGKNMYSSSTARSTLLESSTFNFYAQGNFATKYLVQPKNIGYQISESMAGRVASSAPAEYRVTAANDALGSITSDWHSNGDYQPEYVYNGYRYDAWGDDYVWTPSVTEVGADVYDRTNRNIAINMSNTSIWKLTTQQRAQDVADYVWLRSGCRGYGGGMYCLGSDGESNSSFLTKTNIRPAIHLNLAALTETVLTDPKNVTTTYNGENQTIGDFNLTAQPDWFNANFYPNGSNDAKRATVTYHPITPLAASITTPKNAGEYAVEVSLAAWKTAIDNEVESYCAANGITDDATKQAMKNNRYPVFDGEAKTETIGGNTYTETDTVRYFKLTINRKVAELVKTDKDNAAPTIAFNPADICASDSATASTFLTFYYESTDGKGHSSPNAPVNKKGDYKVTATCVNSNYQIKNANGTNGTMYYTFSIAAKRRALPFFEPATRNYDYGKDLKFQINEGLEDGESGIFTYSKPNAAELPTEYAGYNKNAFTWDGGNLLATATKAGKYVIKVEIADPESNEWADVATGTATSTTARYIEFEVNPLPIELSFDTDRVEGDTGILDCMYEEDRDVTVGCSAPESDDDTIYVKFIARRNGRDTVIFDCLTINRSSVEDAFLDFNCTLAISKIAIEADYELVLDFADGYDKNENYELKLAQPITLHVSANAGESKVLWQIKHDGKTVGSKYVAEADKDFVYDVPGTYDGKEFTFVARGTGIGCEVDTSFNSAGYVRGYRTEDADGNAVKAINAGTYKTYVRLIKTDGSSSEPVVYSITYTINKGLIDLSKIKWIGDGQIEWNGTLQKPDIDPETLPDGLKQNVTATSGMNIGQGGPASVTFSLEGDALKNYVCPVQGDLSTYLLNGVAPTAEWEGWSINWQIVAKELTLYYMPIDIVDKNGVLIPAAQQFADQDNKQYITYEYYECDQSGKITNTTPVTELEVEENKVKYYVAKAKIAPQFGSNVILNIPTGGNPNGYSVVFEVGTTRQEVKLAAKNDKVKYNGKNQPFGVTVTQGTLDESAFNFSYQSGTTQLGSAPKDVGVYTVTVTLKPSYAANYYIKDGKVQFSYEIEKNVIDVNWNDSLKPPALSVNAVQIKGIEYEYKDGSGNTLQFADLANGNTYYIRAKIKDLKNFEFAANAGGNESYTDWKEFSVANNDVLYDPTDPGNPNYPTDDPDDPNVTSIKVVWHGSQFIFNGQLQGPTYSITDMDGNPLTGVNVTIGGIKKAMYAKEGGYTITATAPSGYKIASGASFTYNIVKNEETGKGGLDDPQNPNSPIYDPGYDPSGDNGEKKPFPLWQIIVGSASLILAILFAALWASFDSKRRKANEEAARYKSHAAAAIAPVGVVGAEIAAGMSVSAWSAIAFSLLGFMLVMLALMLVARAKCLKAVKEKELAYADMVKAEKEERLRKEQEEKEDRLRREQEEKEDRRRRDDDMKMMLASMMNAVNTRPAPAPHESSGDNVELIVGRVVQALLPTMQAMLPQAQQNIQYIPYNEHLHAEPLREDEEDEIVDDEWDMDDDDDELPEAELSAEETVQEAEIVLPKKLPSNFRARLKVTSDKNRETYSLIKNEFCSRKGVAYRVCGRVEKIKFHGDLIAVIGVAKRSVKLWLALDPNEFDVERYFHKDMSDKPRYANVPMYLKVGSQRARNRVLELLDALFEKFGIEARRKYEDKPIQELIFTLKGNKLLKEREFKHLLTDNIHVDDASVLDDDTAERCMEIKDIDHIENEIFETLTLDTLSENFVDGQKVTLDALKKKGLVSPDCTGYQVTAGNRINKPLIIHANEFTLPAVKMIVLTGGRAIKLFQY